MNNIDFKNCSLSVTELSTEKFYLFEIECGNLSEEDCRDLISRCRERLLNNGIRGVFVITRNGVGSVKVNDVFDFLLEAYPDLKEEFKK